VGWTAEELRFDSQQGQEIFLLARAFKPAQESTQLPVQLVAGRKASVAWSCNSTPHMPS